MSPAPFRPAFIQLNVEWAFVWGYDSAVLEAAGAMLGLRSCLQVVQVGVDSSGRAHPRLLRSKAASMDHRSPKLETVFAEVPGIVAGLFALRLTAADLHSATLPAHYGAVVAPEQLRTCRDRSEVARDVYLEAVKWQRINQGWRRKRRGSRLNQRKVGYGSDALLTRRAITDSYSPVSRRGVAGKPVCGPCLASSFEHRD